MRDNEPRSVFKRFWVAPILLFLGLLVTGFFGLRAYHQWDYARKVEIGEIRVESLRGWMTLPYISKTYHVPEIRIRQVLGLPISGNADRSLRVWFTESGIDPAQGRLKIEAILLEEGANLVPAAP